MMEDGTASNTSQPQREAVSVPLSEMLEKLRKSHPDIDGKRYALAKWAKNMVHRETRNAAAGSTRVMDQICTVDLVVVFLEIMLDPTIYVWHDEFSPYYHPKLEVSGRMM